MNKEEKKEIQDAIIAFDAMLKKFAHALVY